MDLNDDEDTDTDNPRAQTEPNRALIVFAHGTATRYTTQAMTKCSSGFRTAAVGRITSIP